MTIEEYLKHHNVFLDYYPTGKKDIIKFVNHNYVCRRRVVETLKKYEKKKG